MAGHAAYFRGIAATDQGSLLSQKVPDPAMVVSRLRTRSARGGEPDANHAKQCQKYLIVKLQRTVKLNSPSDKRQPTVWNAQVPRDDAGDAGIGDLSCLHRDDVARMTPRQKAWCPDVENTKWWDDPEWWSDDSFTGSGGTNPSPDDPPTGPPPGPPPVAGITWYHGDPGPQCRPTGRGLRALPRDLSPVPQLTGAGQCGVPCNLDWYCDWWPSGLPPFYYDPKDPVRARVCLGRVRRCGRTDEENPALRTVPTTTSTTTRILEAAPSAQAARSPPPPLAPAPPSPPPWRRSRAPSLPRSRAPSLPRFPSGFPPAPSDRLSRPGF